MSAVSYGILFVFRYSLVKTKMTYIYNDARNVSVNIYFKFVKWPPTGNVCHVINIECVDKLYKIIFV